MTCVGIGDVRQDRWTCGGIGDVRRNILCAEKHTTGDAFILIWPTRREMYDVRSNGWRFVVGSGGSRRITIQQTETKNAPRRRSRGCTLPGA